MMSESNLEQVIEAVKSLTPAQQQVLRDLLNEENNATSRTTKNDLAERGQRLYDEHFKAQLEPEHNGRFCAIEPDSGQYFLGNTGTEAMMAAQAVLPDKKIYLLRIGHSVTHQVGGYGIRIRRRN